MFNQPHGFYVDNDGNVWVTDERARNGKGGVAVKFSPQGQVLMTLGKAGMPGNTPDMFNGPSSIVVAPNGDVYVGVNCVAAAALKATSVVNAAASQTASLPARRSYFAAARPTRGERIGRDSSPSMVSTCLQSRH
jgi:streptogramin lyase